VVQFEKLTHYPDIAQDDRGIEFYQQRKHFRRFEKIFVAEHFAAASDIYSLEA